MSTKKLFSLPGWVSVFALLFMSCAPAATPAPAGKAAESPVSYPKTGVTSAAPSPTPKSPSEQSRYGGTLKHSLRVDENTLDVHVTGRSQAYGQAGPAYNGLVTYDSEDSRKIIPDLAESYQVSTDGKKITFRLNKNIKWHDGKAFSSEDVKFNFQRWMKPPQGVTIARKELAAPVERVETPDPNTVEIHLAYPSPSFMAGIATPSAVMLPPQYLKDHKTMEFTVLGTGPFKLQRYNRGASLEYVKNRDYFVRGRPYLDRLSFYMIPDEMARFAAFRTGQIRTMFIASMTMTVTHGEVLKREMSDKVSVARLPGMTIFFLFLSVNRPPFNDVRVRQAVDMALDRKKGLDVVEGRGELSGPMIPGPWALPNEELLQRPGYRGVSAANIETAKAMLAEAGYPKGLQTDGMIQTSYTTQMAFIKDQLKAIGIDVSIKVVDVATMESRQLTKDYGMTFNGNSQPLDDPDLYLSFSTSDGGRNYSGFSDKEVDDWYKEQSRTVDPAKRKDIVLKFQRKVLDLAPSPILYHGLYEVPYWKCVKGYYPEKALGASYGVKKDQIWLAEGCG
ncbi:MAG: ABC transporter substrate-binding protein [Chloroflexi bacterium]|nr:ABC transporter substrate-binding protein [Chloroflexota bacterium]